MTRSELLDEILHYEDQRAEAQAEADAPYGCALCCGGGDDE